MKIVNTYKNRTIINATNSNDEFFKEERYLYVKKICLGFDNRVSCLDIKEYHGKKNNVSMIKDHGWFGVGFIKTLNSLITERGE